MMIIEMGRHKGPIERPHRLNMLLSDEERALVFRLAARDRVEVSTYVRSLIYREAEKHFGWAPEGEAKKGARR